MWYIKTKLLILIAVCVLQIKTQAENREFRVDYENDRFLMDGKPFRFISGEFHYYRVLPETWRQKMRTMRAAGLNTLSTYIEWSFHNPKPDEYHWDGWHDIEQFIRIAAEEDLYVIFRPGPYICSERENGGFPYWLLTKYPDIRLRMYDEDYLRELRTWYNQLFPRITHHLYGNGGPIIMVQVENEYGSFACDRNYSIWLRDETLKHVGDKAVLFTNDGPEQTKCGKIENVLATLDFGYSPPAEMDSYWATMRKYQPKGPLVASEFYPGWLTHWQQPVGRVPAQPLVDAMRYLLDEGASVNLLMFYGGTNFGFTAGANDGGPGSFEPDVTSYDFDAPMDEAGDPTPKYMILRDAIKDYLPLPNISVPARAPKLTLPPLKLAPKMRLLSPLARQKLARPGFKSDTPIVTFEHLNQYSGFLLYETVLPKLQYDPSILEVKNIHDRAIVLIDDFVVGYLSRQNQAHQIALNGGYSGKTLQILVENQGRVNYHIANDFKGIMSDVNLNNVALKNWTISGFPLEDVGAIENLIAENIGNEIEDHAHHAYSSDILTRGPVIYHATFHIDAPEIHDTYFNPEGWGKGILFINGFNLGRYWPLAGPQITLFVPKQLLRKDHNKITLIELEKAARDYYVTFGETAIFN